MLQDAPLRLVGQPETRCIRRLAGRATHTNLKSPRRRRRPSSVVAERRLARPNADSSGSAVQRPSSAAARRQGALRFAGRMIHVQTGRCRPDESRLAVTRSAFDVAHRRA